MAVEELDRIGEGLDGIVVARVLETRPDRGRQQDPPGRGRRRRRPAPRGRLRRVQHVGRRPRPPGHRRHRDAQRHGDRPPQDGRRRVQRHALLVHGARARRRPRRHPPAARRTSSPARPFTEAMGIEHDVLYDLEINPNRPDAMSVAGVARDLAARLRLPFALPEPDGRPRCPPTPSSASPWRSSTPTCAAASRPGCSRGVQVGPGDPAIAARLAAARHAVDQQRGRRVELRDARAGPAQPPLRPGQGGRPRVPGPAGPRRRAAHHPRRGRAARSPPTTSSSATPPTQPVGLAGIMGGGNSEIDDATTDVLLEMAWFHPIGIVKSSRRLKLRSEASARFEKGTDPEVIDLAMRRFAELLAPSGARLEDGRAVADGELPPLRPVVRVRTRPGRRRSSARSSRSRPHRRAARPDRLHHHAGRRRRRRGDPAVAVRLRHRDRRDRGDRPAPRLRGARPHGARGRTSPAA